MILITSLFFLSAHSSFALTTVHSKTKEAHSSTATTSKKHAPKDTEVDLPISAEPAEKGVSLQPKPAPDVNAHPAVPQQ